MDEEGELETWEYQGGTSWKKAIDQNTFIRNLPLLSIDNSNEYTLYESGAQINSDIYVCSNEIILNAGQTVYAIASGSGTVAILAVYENGVYKKDKSIAGTSKEEIYIIFTADVNCTVRISSEIQYSPNRGYMIAGYPKKLNESIENINTSIEGINKSIDAMEESLYKEIHVDSSEVTKQGYIYYTDGTLIGSANNFKNTDYMQLKKGDRIKYKTAIGAAACALAYYNESKVYNQSKSIRGVGSTPIEQTIIADENCFVIISFENGFEQEDFGYSVFTSMGSSIEEINTSIENTNSSIEEINSSIEEIKQELGESDNCITQRDLNVILVIGQSLSVGGGSQGISDKYYNSLCLNEGVYVWNIDSTTGFAVPVNGPETAVRSMNQSFLESLIKEKNNNSEDLDTYGYKTIMLVYGAGGAKLSVFEQQKENIKNLLLSIKEKALQQYDTICIPAIGWVQGEADKGTRDDGLDYKNRLKGLFNDLNSFIKENFNQGDVEFVTYQTASYEAFDNDDKRMMIPIMHYEIAHEMPNVSLGMAMYQLPYNYDLTHIWLLGTRLMGATMGYYAYERVMNKNKINAISYKSHRITQMGNKYIIEIDFDVPYPPLVEHKKALYNPDEDLIYKDFTGQNVVPNLGFEIMNSDWEYGEDVTWEPSGEKLPTVTNWKSDINIESATIVRGTTVKIVCDKNPAGKELWYARRGNQCGGYIRDSMYEKTGKTIYINASNTVGEGNTAGNKNVAGDYPLNNWMPILLIEL